MYKSKEYKVENLLSCLHYFAISNMQIHSFRSCESKLCDGESYIGGTYPPVNILHKIYIKLFSLSKKCRRVINSLHTSQ